MRFRCDLLLYSTCLFLVSACSFQQSKMATGGAGSDRAQERIGNYQSINFSILGPKCVGCHSSSSDRKGGVALDSYEAVRSQIGRIGIRALERRDMPPAAPLSSVEQATLSDWIKSGAPELGQARRKIQVPSAFGYQFMKQNVLDSCLQCHSSPTPEGNLDLSELVAFQKSVTQIFERVIVRHLCPLPPLSGLSEDQQVILVRYVSQGMPE